MPDLITWFFNYILPWFTIAVFGGAWGVFRKVDKLRNDLAVLTKDCHQLTEMVNDKWREVDTRVRQDLDSLKKQVDYMANNNISRDEFKQYIDMLNSTVDRLSETLNRLL